MDNGLIFEWMLEKDNPSIKYRTLTELLDKTIEDIEVQETYNFI